MKSILIIFFLIFSSGGFAASTRTTDADTITSSDKTKTWTMPATSGTLLVSGTVAIASQFNRDTGAGNGSTTIYTLTNAPASTSEARVFLDGILQILTTDYTISGTTLTFVTAPALGQNITVLYSRF